jgi:hypothetical protein
MFQSFQLFHHFAPFKTLNSDQARSANGVTSLYFDISFFVGSHHVVNVRAPSFVSVWTNSSGLPAKIRSAYPFVFSKGQGHQSYAGVINFFPLQPPTRSFGRISYGERARHGNLNT